MPFDGADLSPVTQALIAARQRIEAGWCQGTGRKGEKVCLAYALDYASGDPWIHRQLAEVVKFVRCVIDTNSIIRWNDTPGRTKEDVLTALDRAIVLSFGERPIAVYKYELAP